MPVVRSIYGDDVEVGIGEYPETHKRLPCSAILVGEVWRGENMFMDLEDKYYLCFSKSKKYRVLWISVKHMGSNDNISWVHQPLTWCPVAGIEPKSAAAAMLEFIWGNQTDCMYGAIYEDSRITAPGLLSVEALQEIKDVALGIYLKEDTPFQEPKMPESPIPGRGLSLHERGLRSREAGPNHPVYRMGWFIGETRAKR